MLVPAVGLEPTRVLPHLILSQARLPFHHTGIYWTVGANLLAGANNNLTY